MAIKTERLDVGNYLSLKCLLEMLPKDIKPEDITLDVEHGWSWGEETHSLVASWQRKETAEEIKARKYEAARLKAEQEERERATLERLLAKYSDAK